MPAIAENPSRPSPLEETIAPTEILSVECPPTEIISDDDDCFPHVEIEPCQSEAHMCSQDIVTVTQVNKCTCEYCRPLCITDSEDEAEMSDSSVAARNAPIPVASLRGDNQKHRTYLNTPKAVLQADIKKAQMATDSPLPLGDSKIYLFPPFRTNLISPPHPG